MMKFSFGLMDFARSTISCENSSISPSRYSIQLLLPLASMHISQRHAVKKKSSSMISSNTCASSLTMRLYSCLCLGSV